MEVTLSLVSRSSPRSPAGYSGCDIHINLSWQFPKLMGLKIQYSRLKSSGIWWIMKLVTIVLPVNFLADSCFFFNHVWTQTTNCIILPVVSSLQSAKEKKAMLAGRAGDELSLSACLKPKWNFIPCHGLSTCISHTDSRNFVNTRWTSPKPIPDHIVG